MNNKIENQISYLNEIADGGIKEDKLHHEFKDISTTLDSIKQEIEKGEGSKEQIKKIIKFLDNQIKTIPNGDFVMSNKLNQYKNDYIKLLQKQNKEENNIRTDSKKDINQIVDENIAKGLITEEKTKKQINFSENQKKTFEGKLDLNNLSSYTVKSGDNLWNIVKKHYPKFTKTNKDIIHIVNYIVNFNTKLEPQKLRHLMRDDKLAWGKNGSDGIAGDTLRVGDILKLPKIKTSDEVVISPGKEEKKENNSDSVKDKPKIIKKTDIPNNSKDNEVNNSTTYIEHFIFKNGRPFLVLEDGSLKESVRELSKKDLEKIKSFEKISMLNEILDIWKTEANNIVDGLFWKSARKDDDIINEQIKGIEKDFSDLFNGAISNKSLDNESLINSIFEKIQKAESEESIIGSDDMEEVKNILLSDNLNKDEKLIKIFNLMRYKGLSGNSTTIKEKTANHLLIQPEFKNISNILNDENLLSYIENNKKDELFELIGNKDLANEIINSYNKIKVKQEKNRENYSKILEKINKEKKTKGEKEIKLDDFIKLNVDYSIQTLIKHTLLETKLNSMPNRGNEDSYKGIYANISGLGETSTGDILVIADNNIDTAIDIGTTLALSAVTMGVGMLAAKGAMMVVNYGTKIAKIGQATSRAGSLARFTGTAGIEGTSFYMGTNTMNNLIYGNFEGNNFGENNLNLKEISKSIAFMGVLRGVSKTMKGISDAKFKKSVAGSTSLDKAELNFMKIGNLTEKVPPLMFKNTSITGVLVEAGLLTGTSTGIEIAFEGEGDWSWEEYIQALVMIGLFRGAGKIELSKNKNGNIKVKTETKKQLNKKTNGKKSIKETTEGTGKEKIKETINEKEYLEFRDKGIVSEKRLNEIAKKVEKREKLTIRENEIFTDKTSEINKIIAGKKKKTSGKENTKESIESTGKEKIKETKKVLSPEKLEKIISIIKSSPKKMDKFMSDLPLYLDKPYKVAKYLVYENKLAKGIGNSIKTPYDIYKNFNIKEFKTKEGFKLQSKNLLFADKDISWKGGVLKIAGYATMPTIVEGIINYQNNESGNISITKEEFIEEVGKDYFSYMYLGVINSIALEYLSIEGEKYEK